MRSGKDHFKDEPLSHAKEEEKPEKPLIPEYTSYPRQFITYKWFRFPVTFVLFFGIYAVLGMLLIAGLAEFGHQSQAGIFEMASGGYDNLDVYTAMGALVSLGSVSLLIPALALANLISGRRTFKSYTSSRGGWNNKIFFICLLIAFIVCAMPHIIDDVFISGKAEANKFTIAGFIVCTIFGPLQCIAEEYAFRGLLLQGFGSWIKFPPLAIIVSSAVFAALHPYNMIGVINIFISGCCFCLCAWISRGLEAGSALHIANNMSAFYLTGLGYGMITSETSVAGLVMSAAINIIFVIAVFICRKRGLFDEVKENDAEKYNARIEAKRAKKAAKKAAKQGE